MSKSVDDPVLISVPSDLKSEGVIRGAIASSNAPYCSKLCFLFFCIAYRGCSYENFPHSESRRLYSRTLDGILKSTCITYST